MRVSGNEQGFFSASCLQHGGNFGFESSPIVNGVTMQEALSNWFFEKGDTEMKYTADMCAEVSSGGSGTRQRYRYLLSKAWIAVAGTQHPAIMVCVQGCRVQWRAGSRGAPTGARLCPTTASFTRVRAFPADSYSYWYRTRIVDYLSVCAPKSVNTTTPVPGLTRNVHFQFVKPSVSPPRVSLPIAKAGR